MRLQRFLKVGCYKRVGLDQNVLREVMDASVTMYSKVCDSRNSGGWCKYNVLGFITENLYYEKTKMRQPD